MELLRRVLSRIRRRRPPEEPARDELLELRARVASLEMDLREREQRITAIQKEYAVLQAGRERAAAEAGQEQLERLFKRLAGTLSNLGALSDRWEGGSEVAVRDLVQLVRSLERELARAGLERVGAAGEAAQFDPAIHQRMSGGTVREGTPVVVRLPGYRLGGKVLLKAMVTAGGTEGVA